VAKRGRFFVPERWDAVEIVTRNTIAYNDLAQNSHLSMVGMDPAFEGARERAKERDIESGLLKRIPYVGTGGLENG